MRKRHFINLRECDCAVIVKALNTSLLVLDRLLNQPVFLCENGLTELDKHDNFALRKLFVLCKQNVLMSN